MRTSLIRPGGAPRAHLPVVLLIPAAAVSAAALIPLLYVVLVTIQTGWGTFVELTFRPRVFELLVNTVGLLVLATPACVVVGVGAAWLVERTQLPGRRLWAVLLAAPLVIPAFVTGYGWVSVVPSMAWAAGRRADRDPGVLPARVPPGRGHAPASRSCPGGGRRQPRSRVRPGSSGAWSCPSCGCRSWVGHSLWGCTCSRSTGPSRSSASRRSRPRSSSSTGPPSTARPPRHWPAVLVVCCLALLLIENVARGGGRYARIGSGSPRPQRRVSLGRMALPAGRRRRAPRGSRRRRAHGQHRPVAGSGRHGRLGR